VDVASRYFSVALAPWVVHEIIITSDDAVNLFWMERWSISKAFFILNVFAAVFMMTITSAANLMAFDSERACMAFTGAQFFFSYEPTTTETYMLATRVWALWRGSYIILTIFFFIVFANFCNYLFTYGIALFQGTVILQTLPYTGCFVLPSYNVEWIGTPNCIAFETLSVGLIFYKTWAIRRLTGIKTPLFSLLLQDGLAHFLLFVAAHVILLGGMIVPTVVSDVVMPGDLPMAVVAVTVNRLFLRLRRTMLHQAPGSTGYITVAFSAIKHSTSGGGNGITIGGGNDKTGRRIHGRRYSDFDDEFSSLGGGDVEMSLSKKDGELHHTASTLRCSTILPTPTRLGSSSNADASVLDSKPYQAV